MSEDLPKGELDWAGLEVGLRVQLIEKTKHLHFLERRTSEYLLDIGKTLTQVKRMLDHGQFGVWLASEFQWSVHTARRFMRVYEVFGEPEFLTGIDPEPKTSKLRDLHDGLSRMSPSAIYALAAQSVPQEVREEFVAKAEGGERVRYQDVKARLDEHRAGPEPVDEEELCIPDPSQTHSTTLTSVQRGPREDLAYVRSRVEESQRLWQQLPSWAVTDIEEGSVDADNLEAIASCALAIHDSARAAQKPARKARMQVVR